MEELWTDPTGTVHIHVLGSERTLCGVAVQHSTKRPHPTSACDACLEQSLRIYAETHTCGKECRAH